MMISKLTPALSAVALAALCNVSLANTVTAVGPNGALTLAVSNSDSSLDFDNGLSTPGTYSYADSFAPSAAGSMFYDSFLITVMPGQLDAITTTIDVPIGNSGSIGISNLASRLFAFTPGVGVAIPTTSAPNGGAINSWTNVVIPTGQSTGYVNVLTDPSISAGTYVLQIEGIPLSDGGSYGGNVNLSAVPLSSSWILLATGLLALGLVQSRRRA